MSEYRLNRVFSRPLTRLLLKSPLTPNQVTLLSLAFGLLASFFFAKGNYGYSLVAASSYQLAVVLDNCDGEVARAKNMRSQLGGWLDVIADILTDMALFLGIASGMKHNQVPGPVDFFLILCLSGAILHFFLVVFEKIKGFGPAVFDAPHPEHERRKNIVLDVFDALREGEASWLVIFFVVIGRTEMLLWTGGVYMQVLWLSAFLLNFRWLFMKKNAGSS